MTENKNSTKSFSVWAYFIEIGWRISIPLVIFIILGVALDKTLGSGHICLFSGIGLSLFTSIYGIKKTLDKIEK